ncbi:hypothetical protein HHK36_018469 [Tetracentron sinense]|uniref:Protein DA1-like domain-containing protein n=1 Tax=Tetracentron sinense TaxID=13715 RepID=A0A834YW24_TETSI|nr:hypothetical protein HHK36_018469 [Tetracentron sinense]
MLVDPITEPEIPLNRAGLIDYRSHPFWCQKYCPSHEHDSTALCCSCERLEVILLPYSLSFVLKSRNTRYIYLGDGRNLCLDCLDSTIMDTSACQPLYHAIRDYYEGLNMKLEQQIPLLLVERKALNEAIEEDKNGDRHMTDTRGLCLSEELLAILTKPGIGGNQLTGMRTHPQKLTTRCEVTGILVLYGLPRLLTGSILAKLLMHALLCLKGFQNSSPGVEDGICQVFSHMWLETEVMPGIGNMPSSSGDSSLLSSTKKGRKSDFEKRLGEFFMHQIAHDKTYREGFRAANEAVNRYGLSCTMAHIRMFGKFFGH